MTTQTYRLKISRVNSLKLKVLSKFPADVQVGNFLTLTKENGVYTFSADYSKLTPGPISDPATAYVALLDQSAGVYRLVSIASLVTGEGTGAVRVVTEAGDITVSANTRLLVMNRASDESPSKINLPAAVSKVGDIKIVDWKGNASAFPHDIYPSGAETFNGAQSVWHISGNGASVALDPIPSLGYAV